MPEDTARRLAEIRRNIGRWGSITRREYVDLFEFIDALTAAGEIVAAELARHGWGDFHYGSTGQEQSVLDALAVWRAVAPDNSPPPVHGGSS